jgi:hypothetical protein
MITSISHTQNCETSQHAKVLTRALIGDSNEGLPPCFLLQPELGRRPLHESVVWDRRVSASKKYIVLDPQYTVEPTLTYIADSRLPLEVLGKAPFIYTGPNPGAFLMGALQGALTYHGRLLPRVHPLAVSEVTATHALIDRVFSWCFFYVNDSDELVLFLTHPCWLNRSDDPALLDFFLTKAEELATYGDCTRIQLEFHDVTSYVAFPTSLTPFSHDVQTLSIGKDDLACLQSHGFQGDHTIQCYEQSVHDVERKTREEQASSSPYQLKSMTSSEFLMRHAQSGPYPIQAYALSRSDPFLAFDNSLSQDVVSAAYTRPRWLRRGNLAGFARWTPNLLEPALAYKLPVPLLFKYAFENYAFTYGKIVDWGFRGGSDDTKLFTALLFHVSHAMKEQGLARIQIGNVNDSQSRMKALLRLYDFQPVHAITLLHKRVM